MNTITEFDFSLLEKISSIRNDVLTPVMKALSYIGKGGIIWVVICIALIIHPKTRKTGICAIIALALDFTLGGHVLKPLIARERPFVQHPWIDTIIARPTGYSLPSGHTGAATSVSVSIFIQNKKLSIPFLILAVGIMFSRLYFCVHFPTDILCGIVSGIVCAVISYIAVNKIYKKRNA